VMTGEGSRIERSLFHPALHDLSHGIGRALVSEVAMPVLLRNTRPVRMPATAT
jgi:hypothetical protein